LEGILEEDSNQSSVHAVGTGDDEWKSKSGRSSISNVPVTEAGDNENLAARMNLPVGGAQLAATVVSPADVKSTPKVVSADLQRLIEESSKHMLPGQEALAASNALNTKGAQQQTDEKGNEPWMKFGIAALGVLAGGVLLSIQGGGEDGDSGGRQRADGEGNSSTVQIEQLSDDGEDEWVSVGNSEPPQ
jgi:hypothetical protein